MLALGVAAVRFSSRAHGGTATADAAVVRTEAVSTFSAELTVAAGAVASSTITLLPPPTAPATAVSGTPDCLGLRYVRDITIPDNTQLSPAELFTKIWQVQNTGTCPWKPGFQVVLIGGLAMGGSPFKVQQTVGPGGYVQISIKMVAPTNQTGVVEGTWKMADSEGRQFGDFLSVVVDIHVRAQASPGSTLRPTP